jgi:hypothetical protein
MTNTEADEINAKVAVILGWVTGEYLPDFARGTMAVWRLVQWLHKENRQPNATGIGVTWGLTQTQEGGYVASTKNPYGEYHGDTANEALCRAIIAYAEAKGAKGETNDN